MDDATRVIRLDAIDAPEDGQEHSAKFREALVQKTLGQSVRVDIVDVDRYQRDVGRVWIEKRSINREMVAEGWAWQYDRYSTSDALAAAEAVARRDSLGLWANGNPVPPWEYRESIAREAVSKRAKELDLREAALVKREAEIGIREKKLLAREKARTQTTGAERDSTAGSTASSSAPRKTHWITSGVLSLSRAVVRTPTTRSQMTHCGRIVGSAESGERR